MSYIAKVVTYYHRNGQKHSEIKYNEYMVGISSESWDSNGQKMIEERRNDVGEVIYTKSWDVDGTEIK